MISLAAQILAPKPGIGRFWLLAVLVDGASVL
jgi:hypothetical protein